MKVNYFKMACLAESELQKHVYSYINYTALSIWLTANIFMLCNQRMSSLVSNLLK